MRAYFAFSIGLPPIDPLLSSRNMYSPLTISMSVSKLPDYRAASCASFKASVQNLGMNETITEEPASVRPKV